MPMYTYKCAECGHEFDELVKYSVRDEAQVCKLCGKVTGSRKEVTRFGISTRIDPKRETVYSRKEIDKVVGSDAEKKWQGYDERWRGRYEERQKKRWGDKEPGPVTIPKDSDGKYSPIMHLGDNKQRKFRKEYSEALKEHRAERKRKGIPQFDGPGAIEH